VIKGCIYGRLFIKGIKRGEAPLEITFPLPFKGELKGDEASAS
jgi:hypothetical protein